MKTMHTIKSTIYVPANALQRCVSTVWLVLRRMGILCWAIGVALINLGEG